MSVLVAAGAGVRHRRRWIFRDLDVTVAPGDLVAVVGPPGSGRTTTLLALAGRFRLSAGKIETPTGTALAHVPGLTDPEPTATVAEHVRERLALRGRPGRDAAGIPLLGLDPSTRGRELTPFQRHLLGLVLAGMESPALIAADDIDTGLDAAERTHLLQVIESLTSDGVAVLVTARELSPGAATTLIRLGAASSEVERVAVTDGEGRGPAGQERGVAA